MKYNELQRQIDAKEAELKRLKAQQARVVKECNHDWTEEYTPEYKEAYTIPGDKPGTMGVDFRGPCHVPAKTIKKWTRTCKKCGCKQVTSRSTTETQTTQKPAW